LRPHDQRGAHHDRDGAEGRRHVDRLARDAQPAEAVEQERGQHLAGDEQPDADDGAQAREQQDAGGDVDRAADAADEMPRLGVVQEPEGADRAGRQCEEGQQAGADGQLQRGGRDRAAGGAAQLHVRRGLQRQQAADEEEEGNGEGFHCEHLI
jgi:hypothetical protein